MGFIGSYNGAMRQLQSIENGNCSGECKSSWMRNLKYALKTKTNPLGLTQKQKNTMNTTIKRLSKRGPTKRTTKKYESRPSPPYGANDYCGKKMKGNDGNIYESRESKSGSCSWKKI
jgi:hypothetical protein